MRERMLIEWHSIECGGVAQVIKVEGKVVTGMWTSAYSVAQGRLQVRKRLVAITGHEDIYIEWVDERAAAPVPVPRVAHDPLVRNRQAVDFAAASLGEPDLFPDFHRAYPD